ncbi:MAG: FAD-dependent oxidoreductase, partial [Candidatus Cloacimonadota bacterium]|nr:FAD-dependent oxidoreductase [Candidatus Cloacimonadota bacterium]
PVGLDDPRTGRWPYAVIQLRTENNDKTSYNLVGCQTMLKYGEQKKIFRLIPGMQKAEFVRFGSIHRNTYLNGPHILNKNLSLKKKSNVFIAGQLAGVEGYVESILSGMLVSRNIIKMGFKNKNYHDNDCHIERRRNIRSFTNSQSFDSAQDDNYFLPTTTISGQLWKYLVSEQKNFQPMNANFGLLPPLEERIRDKKLRKQKYSERAIKDLQSSSIIKQ